MTAKMTRKGSMKNLKKSTSQTNFIGNSVTEGSVHFDLTQSNVINQDGENIVQENSYLV
ncbi:MAG: hypothetical protein RLZZ263_856 [Cyanobacteriota bacterium]